ncbi:hypothetical protein EDD21DRAFT_75199 [Dissophora ornata]|nr:hypothetical protein EDD21DRAFT_75199 [Dissophora ornata]
MSRVVISSRRCLPPSDPFHNNTHLERVFIPQVAQSTSPLPGTFARCRKSFSQLATSSSLLLLLLLLAESPMISTVAAADVAPSWRAFHGAAVVDTSMVIFGGTANPNIDPFGSTVAGSNDLWVWSTTLRQWSQPTTQFTPGNSTGTNVTTTGPNPQKFLSSIPLQSQGRMMSIVSNSTTGSIQGDLLILDTIFWTWSIPTSRNALLSYCHGFAHRGPRKQHQNINLQTICHSLSIIS